MSRPPSQASAQSRTPSLLPPRPASLEASSERSHKKSHTTTVTSLSDAADKGNNRVCFKLRFFLEMALYHVLSVFGVGLMASVRGRTFVCNTVLFNRSEFVFSTAIFLLLVWLDLWFWLVLTDDHVTYRAKTDMVIVHVLWLVHGLVVACQYAFLSLENQHELAEVPISAGEEILPNLSTWLRPSPRIIRSQIRHAEHELEVDTRRMRLFVNAAVQQTVVAWSESAGPPGPLPATDPDDNQPTHCVSITAALLALCRIAISNTPFCPRRVWFRGLLTSTVVVAVASLYRQFAGSWATSQPFGTADVSYVQLVLVVVVDIALLGRLYVDLLLGERVFNLKSQTRASLRELFRLDQLNPPAFSLERDNLIAFLTLCKVLRRLGWHPIMHVHAIMTGYIFMWLTVVVWMVVGALTSHFIPIEFVVVEVCVTITLTVCIVNIIIRGTAANDQHNTTKQLLLEIRLATNSPYLGTVVSVLDHLDNDDAVKVFGVRCSRALVNSIFAFFFSAVTVYLRMMPSRD